MKLAGRLVPVAEVTARQREEMLALMRRHYAGLRRAAFQADLVEKQWVIQVVDEHTQAILGFSTQVLLAAEIAGHRVQALFSGDTIVDRSIWGQNHLAQVWGRFALSLIDSLPGTELYWFLISKGYKTYRFLPLFFHEFYPRHDRPTPPWAEAVIRGLGQTKFGEDFDATAGIMRANDHGYRLRPGVAGLTAERLNDPHIRFFAERNPRHAQGDELCCLAPLTTENFTRAAYRVIGPERIALTTR